MRLQHGLKALDLHTDFDVHRQGAQGKLDKASNAELDNEFGTHKEDDVVKQILEKGNLQETKVRSFISTACFEDDTNGLICRAMASKEAGMI